MSVSCDGYTNDVQTERHRRARKEHRCCACKETIRKGDIYRATFVVFEGSVDTYKHCLRCARMFDELCARIDGYDEGVDWHLNCGHSWEENHGECPPEIAALAFMTPDMAQRELAPRKGAM